MRKINKRLGYEPNGLRRWKRNNTNGKYSQLYSSVKQEIRLECAKEQFYLCSYCCRAVSGTSIDCMNEHVVARAIDQSRELDFSNIVTSCIEEHQCDRAHGCQPLPLTPFDSECETDLIFRLNGMVEGLTTDAKETIKVLNLNKGALVEERREIVTALLIDDKSDTNNITYDEELIRSIIFELNKVKQGKLEPFSPVIINVLRHWIK